MTESSSSQPRQPPEEVATLIRTARRLQQQGDTARARVVLRALSVQRPGEPAVWLMLATVAETRAEQRMALEQVLVLDPHNPLALRGLAHIRKRAGVAQVQPPPPPDHPPDALPIESPAPADLYAPPTFGPPWMAYAIVASLALTLLIVLWRPWEARPPGSTGVVPTPALQAAATASAAGVDAFTTLPLPSPAAQAAPIPSGAIVGTPLPSPMLPSPAPPPQPEAGLPSQQQVTGNAPTPTPQPTVAALAPGTIIEQGIWRASLLRPDYALVLDGSIGSLQPRGRFVLALVAVAQTGDRPERLPEDLIFLVDHQGARYRAVAGASSAFLDTYGRGQRGDLSMEEPIPEGGGNVSVPIIFDVPETARALRLYIGGSALGWPIGP